MAIFHPVSNSTRDSRFVRFVNRSILRETVRKNLMISDVEEANIFQKSDVNETDSSGSIDWY